MMLKLSKYERLFMLCLSVLLILFFYLKYYELPEISKIKKELANYKNAAQLLMSSNVLQKNKDTIRKSIESSSNLISGIPDRPVTSDIAAYLSKYANGSGIKPGILSILSIERKDRADLEQSSTKKLDILNVINMSYSVKGNYADLISFIKDIEECPRKMNIISISMVNGYMDSGFILTLNLKCYYFADQYNEDI